MADHEVDREVMRRYRAGEDLEGFHRERILLLTTTGRRSGEPRSMPMMFLLSGGEPLVVASDDGAPVPPAWFRNLSADPAVVVELPDGTSGAATAEVLDGEERAAAWQRVVAAAPFFAEHQERAGRRLPLVALHLQQ